MRICICLSSCSFPYFAEVKLRDRRNWDLLQRLLLIPQKKLWVEKPIRLKACWAKSSFLIWPENIWWVSHTLVEVETSVNEQPLRPQWMVIVELPEQSFSFDFSCLFKNFSNIGHHEKVIHCSMSTDLWSIEVCSLKIQWLVRSLSNTVDEESVVLDKGYKLPADLEVE